MQRESADLGNARRTEVSKGRELPREVEVAAHFGIARVGVEHVREELARDSHAGNDQPMNIEAVDREQLVHIRTLGGSGGG